MLFSHLHFLGPCLLIWATPAATETLLNSGAVYGWQVWAAVVYTAVLRERKERKKEWKWRGSSQCAPAMVMCEKLARSHVNQGQS